MKKDILKLFYLPVILWIIVSIVYFTGVYYAVNNHVKNNYYVLKKLIINEKKRELKNKVENFEYLFKLIKNTVYSYTEFELNQLVSMLIKNNINHLYKNDTFILGKIPANKKFQYQIYENRYIILNLRNRKYIVVLKNRGKNIYIFGIRKAYIDNFIMNKIINYLDEINKNAQSYIALGKIETLNPKNNGFFGYLYYMPPKLKYLEGLDLSINKPDMRGKLFRKKYLECFKKGSGCFVSYYWINPDTKKIEKKISYFDYIKENNLSVVAGIYKSQILKELKTKFAKEKRDALLIFKFALVSYFLILLVFILLEHIIFGKLKDKMIGEYEQIIKELKEKTYVDNVTKLGNRIKLFEEINNFQSLVLMDIDNFSSINDVYGFEEGDKILKYISNYLKKRYKNVYRIGSDEFALGLEEKIDEEFLNNFSNITFEIDGIEINFVLGASNFKEKLFETAEMALKLAISSKKEKFVLYNEKMFLEQKKKIKKINILKSVLQKKDIYPYYQCIVDKNGNILKYESLMRIKVKNEFKTPYYFMDLIKDARIYDEFSMIMIKKVLEDVRKIDKKVSINLSYEDIVNKKIVDFILKSLDKEISRKIVFEILESESIQNYDIVKNFIFKVKEKGSEIAIDDFGSGYSNFVQVLSLEPDIIKIDATLIKNIKDVKNYKMVELIINFAKSFNLKTVAEFVSSKEIFDIVKNMGIDEFQGFYFCEPQPFDKILSKKGNNET